MRDSYAHIKQAARGNWKTILEGFGVPPKGSQGGLVLAPYVEGRIGFGSTTRTVTALSFATNGVATATASAGTALTWCNV